LNTSILHDIHNIFTAIHILRSENRTFITLFAILRHWILSQSNIIQSTQNPMCSCSILILSSSVRKLLIRTLNACPFSFRTTNMFSHWNKSRGFIFRLIGCRTLGSILNPVEFFNRRYFYNIARAKLWRKF